MNDSQSTVACSVHGSTLVATILMKQLRESDAIQQLKDELLAAVTLARPRNVVIDLSHVEFIGSVGFLVFLRIRREPTVSRIVLSNLNESVRGAFLICQLISENSHRTAPFEAATTTQDALERCGEA